MPADTDYMNNNRLGDTNFYLYYTRYTTLLVFKIA